MKKLRILSIVAMLLCVVTVLASCGGAGTIKLKDVYKDVKYVTETPRLSSAAKLDGVGTAIGNFNRCLVRFTGNAGGFNEQKVFNLATGQVVGTYTDTAATTHNVSLFITNASAGYRVGFYTVTATTAEGDKVTSKTTLYTAAGTQVAEVARVFNADVELDVVRFGDKCYRVAEDGGIAAFCDWPELAGNLPTLDYGSKKYYVAELPGTADGFAILNKKDMETLTTYVFPQYAAFTEFFPLQGGDVLVQYLVPLPDDAEKYDLLRGTPVVKYDVVQQLFNAKKGTLKDVKSDYLYNTILPDVARLDPELANLNKSVKNLGVAFEIVDKRTSETAADALYLSVSNGGKAEKALNRSVPGMTFAPEVVADGVLSVRDVQNRTYLYSEKGKLIGEVTGINDRTDTYLVSNSKVYDYALKEVFDYEAEGYTFVRTMRSGIIFSKDNAESVTEYYLFNGGMNKITTGVTQTYKAVTDRTETVVSDRVYEIHDLTAGTYAYYNDWGVKLTETRYALTLYTSENAAAFIATCFNTETATSEFYYFK